ncbi:class I SAM-dependent methyltransferase [Parendozoicomonas haliclonae]|uniref:Bifunctional 3-demethylubiquinone-9 3-methyltransferase/ 2-octaprenyl-6-hydroxy phenol methylase n=1 Tax=Parendozoicomonas haliclonae TaxID=1960125 RepID=A0A1X7AMZ5_9GAMM|nr:class I SAM-dependent methyltransferase [Parendozoicomonas haliclonae]SMA49681.1 bifunctional 3-demethylubiquinone-9 3-methyltransferase/ 2-octaprenyl-6-hydroxy phenol methylase [Parendozoicomonas haliclonae]
MLSCKTIMNDLVCPLCGESHIKPWWQDKYREYLRCQNCQLVFVPKVWHLSNEEEKACYDLHENSGDDSGYRRFLSRMFDPITALVRPPAIGLEFGCGPGPVLAEMFAEAGFTMKVFDIYYANNPDVIDPEITGESYDFITTTEVVEHLSEPNQVLERLLKLLAPGGMLGIMTKLVMDQEAFKTWHYIRDRTHISFFSKETFEWFAQQHNCQVEFVGADVILLRKQLS